MNTLKVFSTVAVAAITSFAIEPQYSIHDKIKGSVQILTNTEEYVVGSISNAASYLEGKIGIVSTNGSNSAMRAIEAASTASTNYTDKVGEEVALGAQKYTIEKVDNALDKVSVTTTALSDRIDKVDRKIDEKGIATEPVEVPDEAAAKGISFVDQYGEDQNVAIAIGKDARAAVSKEALEQAPSNTIVRSVSIAIGAKSDATAGDSSIKNQAIAIGFHAQAKANNAIAIGSGAEHPNETAETGNATVASGGTAIAIGYDAKAKSESGVSIGRSAKTDAKNAVQIGTGFNTEPNSLQFLSYKILDSEGQIPTNRLAKAAEFLEQIMVRRIERTIRPGNMEMNCLTKEEQIIEPMLNGVSEFSFSYSNGVWLAGGEAGIIPPLGSRNYNLLIKEIPQAIAYTNGVPYYLSPEDNFIFECGEELSRHNITMICSPEVGVMTHGKGFALTNSPAIIKVREPSSNSLIIVAKPWNPIDL